jgi:hypothetical protein
MVHSMQTCTYLVSRLALSQNGPKWASSWASSPRSTIGCVQKWFMSLWYVWRKPCTYLTSTLTPSPNDRCETPHDPCNLGVPSGVSKMISKPNCTFSANRATILCQDLHYLQMDRNELSFETHHLGVPSGVSKTIYKPMIRSAQTVHLSCIKISTISKWTETSFHLSLSARSTIGCVQKDFWADGTLAQTVHLSCTNTNIVSKQKEVRFHMTHAT